MAEGLVVATHDAEGHQRPAGAHGHARMMVCMGRLAGAMALGVGGSSRKLAPAILQDDARAWATRLPKR